MMTFTGLSRAVTMDRDGLGEAIMICNANEIKFDTAVLVSGQISLGVSKRCRLLQEPTARLIVFVIVVGEIE